MGNERGRAIVGGSDRAPWPAPGSSGRLSAYANLSAADKFKRVPRHHLGQQRHQWARRTLFRRPRLGRVHRAWQPERRRVAERITGGGAAEAAEPAAEANEPAAEAAEATEAAPEAAEPAAEAAEPAEYGHYGPCLCGLDAAALSGVPGSAPIRPFLFRR